MNDNKTDDNLLAQQEIIHVEQTIEGLEKKQTEYNDWLSLYNDLIQTSFHQYSLRDVFDISYRWSPGQIGFLYLHTTGGVRTFHIKTDPSPFIHQFQQTDHI
ncbi:hypothetical protein D7Z54_20400 [Salibacterium salarium]|uniref:Uncharacterized protein n=1 Tax=Salibacterium salarium TaxID=284579 RepID=A0A3R9RBD9_9BACI|nr:hypothetical protein [Salibacterium salarium]RSL31597.1 hypothetical protein D7Z54_20400 [Salibacterium salarium]